MIQLTQKILDAGKSIRGGWNTKQIRVLGDDMTNGWRFRILGKHYPQSVIDEFLSLKNAHFNKEKLHKVQMKKRHFPVFEPVYKTIEYKEQYLHPNWQKMRLFVLNRDSFKCVECGSKEDTLHVHHLKYLRGKFIWEVPPYYLVSLCEGCHSAEHGRDLTAKRG